MVKAAKEPRGRRLARCRAASRVRTVDHVFLAMVVSGKNLAHIIGTKVRDSRNELTMAKATARASGLNRKPPMPGISQPGRARCWWSGGHQHRHHHFRRSRPGRPGPRDLPMCSCGGCSPLDDGVVDQRADGQARPPSVMALIVLPVVYRPMIAPRTASGMDMLAMNVMHRCRGRSGS